MKPDMLCGRAATLVAVLVMATAAAGIGAEPDRVTLSGHVPAAVFKLAPSGRLPATNTLTLAIGLPLRNQSGLGDLIRQLYDPGSTNYHQYLSTAEFAAAFGPTEQDYQAVVQFAQSNGLSVDATYPTRLVLGVTGAASDIERAFHITLRTYHLPTEARDFFAPDTEPSVPANLRVSDIEGLNDFVPPRPLSHRVSRSQARPLSFNGSGPNGEYAGPDFRNAYVPGTRLTGAGQTVGLFELSSYYKLDVTNYENIIGQIIGYTNHVPLTNVVVGRHSPGTANNLEVALDIEMAIAMAPGLSRVIVYEENYSGTNTPALILGRMASDNLAKQMSSSWSWGGGPTNTVDNVLLEMAAQGQSFFQASGDSDAYTGANQLDNASAAVAPVDSTNLTAVGGTSLTMNGIGASWAAETNWNYNLNGIPNEGSGGGISSYYTIPWWQQNLNPADNQVSAAFRNVPDVALIADNVFACYDDGTDNGADYIMGTSCAAPLWAAFTALVNQQSALSGHPPVGFLNPALYAIGAGTNYTACFHDITAGNNIGTNTPGLYYATNGYDLCTGWGTPTGTNLINALAPYPYVVTPPASQTVTNGNNVSFSVTAGGQPAFSYAWQFNGTNLSAGSNLSGNQGNVLTITSVTPANAGNYRVVVANNYGAVTSSVATLTVVYPPLFSADPTNLTVLGGGNAVFSAMVSGATPLSYQWQQNGRNLVNGGDVSGAATNVLTLTAVTTNNAGNYSLVATNLFGSATSSVASLTVVLPPAITVALTNQTIQCGSNAISSVTASGTSPLAYQWSLDGVTLAGATNSSLLLTNVHFPNHIVAVVVTNLYGTMTNSAMLTVEDTLPPVITLLGANPFFVELGQPFVDPGATAYDLCAGTVPVTSSGTVNT
ncbi:MAG: protease pro-enzyme activation domain-containing protein, partial [Verrucomicrobiota bacterium]